MIISAPKISVILPNYNYDQFLNQRIASILNQTYSNFELLILDDCSTDNSKAVIESFKDKRITVYYNDTNTGSPFPQWDKGIQLSKGDYIWIAEADDYCSDTMLEKLLKKLEESKSDVCFAESKVVNEHGVEKGLWCNLNIKGNNKSIFNTDFDMNGNEFIEKNLIFENAIPNASAVLFKKKSYIEAGGVDQNIPNCADWLLWIKILSNGRVAFVSEPLNAFRRHGESVINSIKKKEGNEDMFYEYYSLTMRLALKKWLINYKGKNVVHKINDRYILKDLSRKINWSKSNQSILENIKLSFQAFHISGFNPKYLLKPFL
ncbi:glycosyltransferase [Formosa sediminum]|uniref:Glycosyltransferase n=1 Tax=Formosa sediminum TaxID=2594004 RepID=A0A516GQ83_9FLAO|nr:glycosyltransferase [Formosa sediminum]QDO93688.1 glycosyltransferase [Formosa sediminum]